MSNSLKNRLKNFAQTRKPIIAKKRPFGRIVDRKTKVVDGREYTYHATKGWRSNRAA